MLLTLFLSGIFEKVIDPGGQDAFFLNTSSIVHQALSYQVQVQVFTSKLVTFYYNGIFIYVV